MDPLIYHQGVISAEDLLEIFCTALVLCRAERYNDKYQIVIQFLKQFLRRLFFVLIGY